MSYRLRFGPYLLPASAATQHFLFVGATQSGKTTLINMLFRSAMTQGRGIANAPAQRAFVYDAKGNQVQWAHAVCSSLRLRLINPFVLESYAWDIAKDAATPDSARQIATILVPEPRHSSDGAEFFATASREVLLACMLLLNEQAPLRWTLRDLLLLALEVEHLESRLARAKAFTARRIANLYLIRADEKTRANVLSSLSASVGVYEPVAAAWSRTRGKYSVAEWGRSLHTLVLGNDERSRSSIDPVNQAIFSRAAETVVASEEVSHEDLRAGRQLTWFFLDELREAEKLGGLRRLLNQGRSRGASVVLGFQDIDGLRAVYTKDEAEEMAGQCSHKAVLRLNSPETALWATKLFGEEDQTVESSGDSVGSHYSANRSRKKERKTTVTTKELLYMPSVSPEHGLTGYYKSPAMDSSPALSEHSDEERMAPWRYAPKGTYAWDEAVAPNLMSQGGLKLTRRPADHFVLLEWTDDERSRLFGDEGPDAQSVFFDLER